MRTLDSQDSQTPSATSNFTAIPPRVAMVRLLNARRIKSGSSYDFFASFLRAAQYFFMRSPMAFFCAAVMGFRFRRRVVFLATGTPVAKSGNAL
jgi:hypothetical protein